MYESETEKGNENTLDWRYSRRNPAYDELNKILGESSAVKKWLRKIKDEKNKRTVLRMWLWWLKNNYPKLHSLGPDGLVRYQKKAKGTNREFEIPDAIEAWLYKKGGHYNTLARAPSIPVLYSIMGLKSPLMDVDAVSEHGK